MFCSLLQKELLEKSEKENQDLQADLAKAEETNKREIKEMKEHVSLVKLPVNNVRKEVL